MTFATSNATSPEPAPAWIWSPAGRDTQLARAISDLTTGQYLGSTRELLSAIRDQYDRRAYCTSVLAAVIARRGLHCADQWLADEPKSADALLLHARVLVVRAIHATRACAPRATTLASQAIAACRRAAQAAASDPTPQVALLCLGEAYPDLPDLASGFGAPDGLEVYGPWSVLAEITERDPFNREAFHRLIPRCCARPAPAWTPDTADEDLAADDDAARAKVAVWAADQSPAGSPLKLLRLMHALKRDPFPDLGEQYRLENYLRANGDGSRAAYLKERAPAIEQRWSQALQSGAVKLAKAWFADGAQPPYMPLSDFSFLAHYLHQVGELPAARLVLEWMIPHATAEPWQRDGDPAAVLAKVCLDCHIPPSWLPR